MRKLIAFIAGLFRRKPAPVLMLMPPKRGAYVAEDFFARTIVRTAIWRKRRLMRPHICLVAGACEKEHKELDAAILRNIHRLKQDDLQRLMENKII